MKNGTKNQDDTYKMAAIIKSSVPIIHDQANKFFCKLSFEPQWQASEFL